jgi:ribulose-phosphate 3-epimerase
MIERPELQLENFAKAGADLITVHVEASPHLHRVLQSIRTLGKKCGVALNPGTPLSSIQQILDEVDLLLIMTVNPGWGGQRYISSSDQKIREARRLLGERKVLLEVDGGINSETARRSIAAGADVLVAGTSIFHESDYSRAIASLRS